MLLKLAVQLMTDEIHLNQLCTLQVFTLSQVNIESQVDATMKKCNYR